MKIKTIEDFDVKDKLVLLRIDINSPIIKNKVLDNPRFKEASDTIKYLLENKAKVIILAHQGRKNEKDYLESLAQHAEILSKYVGKTIKYENALFEDKALEAIDKLEMGEALLMKNVRAYDDETIIENSRFYSFSTLFDLYVNDAFSVSHRSQGSIVIPPQIIESCIGLGFEKELNALEHLNLEKIKDKKAVYLIGGEKVADYLPIFNVLKNKNAKILASGVLANLFLIANGKDLGYENLWTREKGYDKLIPALKKIFNNHKEQVLLPIDFAVGDKNIEKARRKEILISDFPVEEKIWDVGYKTTEFYIYKIQKSDIIFMKGPLGYSEIEDFSYSTVEILNLISKLAKAKKVFSLLGGGHLTTTIEKYKIPNHFTHISTSGGALIAFISGETLPGIEAIEKGIKKQ